MSSLPEDRPETYDPDKTWDETNDEWSDDPTVLVETAARYKGYFIAASNGEIYYAEV